MNKQQQQITALYADVIIGTNPESLENTGVLPIQSHFLCPRFG